MFKQRATHTVLGLLLLALLAPLCGGRDWTDWYATELEASSGVSAPIYILDQYNKRLPEGAKVVVLHSGARLEDIDSLPGSVEHLTIQPSLASQDGELAEALAKLPRLAALVLIGCDEGSANVIKGLAGLAELRSISLVGRISIELIAEVAKCKQLSRVEVSGAIAPSMLEELGKLPNLRHFGISLDRREWSDEIVAALRFLSHVESLSCKANPQIMNVPWTMLPDGVVPESWLSIASLKKLTAFEGRSLPGLKAEVLTEALAGKQLVSIDAGLLFSAEQLKKVLASRKLERVDVGVEAESAKAGLNLSQLFGGLRSLRSLRIAPVTAKWSGLNSLTQLDYLSVGFLHESTKEELEHIVRALPKDVKELRIGNLPAGAVSTLAQWTGASQCTSIRLWLTLDEPGEFGTALSQLRAFKKLRRLELEVRGNVAGIKSADWGKLHGLALLEVLTLHVGEIGAIPEVPLRPSQHATYYYQFSATAVQQIVSHPTLKSLDLGYERFEKGALAPVRSSKLVSLCLEGVCELSSEDIDAVAGSNIANISLAATLATIQPAQLKLLVGGQRRLVDITDTFLDPSDECRTILIDRTGYCVVLSSYLE